MEKPTVILGIDISKQTLDVCQLEEDKKVERKLPNNHTQVKKYLKKFDPATTVIAMEHTGANNSVLYDVLDQSDFRVYVYNPYHLKHSLGIIRGKTDKLDAFRIAQFTQRNLDIIVPFVIPQPVIRSLKLLLSERAAAIKDRRRIKSVMSEKASKLDKAQARRTKQRRQRRVKDLDRYIKEVESDIKRLINSDERIKKVTKLATSVPGIGPITAWHLVAKTNGFTIMTDPRKLACYAGVAPFQHQSGSSINKSPRVSHMADKKLKTVLHMAALRVTRLEGEMRDYYIRKVAQGKNKMAVINALRNKLIHRVIAVINRGEPYQTNPPKSLHLS